MKALYSNEQGSCFWLHFVTFWAWVRYGTHDLFDLVDSGSPRKQSFTLKHLSQDAAQAPHIHTFSVPLDNRYWLTIDLENTISAVSDVTNGDGTSRIPAESRELGTNEWRRTPSALDYNCPLGIV